MSTPTTETNKLSDAALRILGEKAKQATPGPWHTNPPYGSTWIGSMNPYGHGEMHIADVRGWGHLTGQGACAFDEHKAATIQDATAEFIAACSPDVIGPLVEDVIRLRAELDAQRSRVAVLTAELERERARADAAEGALAKVRAYAETHTESCHRMVKAQGHDIEAARPYFAAQQAYAEIVQQIDRLRSARPAEPE